MKTNIVITTFQQETVEQLLEWVKTDISYEDMTVGLHIDATREHYHIAICCSKTPLFRGKEVSDLSKYYRKRVPKTIDFQDIKFSFYGCLDPKFDKKKCLAYPLKEYESFSDICFREYITLDDQTLEQYRIFSHEIWCAKKYREEREHEKKQTNEQSTNNLSKFLRSCMWDDMLDQDNDYVLLPRYLDPKASYLYLYTRILEYNAYQQKKLVWRWTDIPNQVLSFMYLQQQWATEDLIKFKEKIK